MTIVGFPRIGGDMELKRALEGFWNGETDEVELEAVAKEIRRQSWDYQRNLEHVTVNDFSLYDNMLDLSIALNAIPRRFSHLKGTELYFSMARGSTDVTASRSDNWFDTNYYFVVPELFQDDEYRPNATKIIKEYREAKALGHNVKISLIGPFTYINLAKTDGDKRVIFDKLKVAYIDLVAQLSQLEKGLLVEFNEPIFAKGKCEFFEQIGDTYDSISSTGIKLIVTTYFDESTEATQELVCTGIYGLGLDLLLGEENFKSLELIASSGKRLFAGIIDGRNIWASDLESKLHTLQRISMVVPKDLISISTSCSLIHVPVSKHSEAKMDREILSWISFAREKIDEIVTLESIFRNGKSESTQEKVEECTASHRQRRTSPKTYRAEVRERVRNIGIRPRPPIEERAVMQKEVLNLPLMPTTTIGSFPQTPEIQAIRMRCRAGQINEKEFGEIMESYIRECIRFQEEIGLDVLVHGEPERGDAVEYFGEHMDGFVLSQHGWVQSCGSHCVKPPVIYGDVSRPRSITAHWAAFAQSLSDKVVKGTLTGPVTIMNWSFVRDDIPRREVCKQIALCIMDEVNDLQQSGIKIIQIDEAALRQGYPLRESRIIEYEDLVLECFGISTSVAKPEVQIHAHICYDKPGDVIRTIKKMDADVVSIENTRSEIDLLRGLRGGMGMGVYDIHSPAVPTQGEIYDRIKLILAIIPKEQVWINPDCGLKARKWEEVKPSLAHLAQATKMIREEII